MFGVFVLFCGVLIGCYLFGTFVLGIYFWSEDWCVPHWVLVSIEKRKYLNSLSREDRRAYLRHERRKKDYVWIMGKAQIEGIRRRQEFYDRTGVDPLYLDKSKWDMIEREVIIKFGVQDSQWLDVAKAPDCPLVPWISGGDIVKKEVKPPVWEPPKWR